MRRYTQFRWDGLEPVVSGMRSQIRNGRIPNDIEIKVGRTTTLVDRLEWWSGQCKFVSFVLIISPIDVELYKTVPDFLLRGWRPGTVEAGDGTKGACVPRVQIKRREGTVVP